MKKRSPLKTNVLPIRVRRRPVAHTYPEQLRPLSDSIPLQKAIPNDLLTSEEKLRIRQEESFRQEVRTDLDKPQGAERKQGLAFYRQRNPTGNHRAKRGVDHCEAINNGPFGIQVFPPGNLIIHCLASVTPRTATSPRTIGWERSSHRRSTLPLSVAPPVDRERARAIRLLTLASSSVGVMSQLEPLTGAYALSLIRRSTRFCA